MKIQYIVNGKVITEKPGSILWNEHIRTILDVAYGENVSTAQVIVKDIETEEEENE